MSDFNPKDSIPQFFSTTGALAHKIKDYQPRDAQIQMSVAVNDAIKSHQKLVVEAGTGTGKTYAYLVPAILSGKKTIVSTGTKHLQDQLYEKDIPLLKSLIKHRPLKVALLKGRANYLCIYKIKTATSMRRGGFSSRKQVNDFQIVEKFLGRTQLGDITQIADISESSSIWPFVTSTTESCLGSECPDFEDCFVFKARKKAMDADLVVINHHLFCADLALKQEGFNELLPNAEVIIIDEAHQLAEVAGLFFSSNLSTKQIADFLSDFMLALDEESLSEKELENVKELTSKFEKNIILLRDSLMSGAQRYALKDLSDNVAFTTQLDELNDNFELLAQETTIFSSKSEALKKCDARAKELAALFPLLTKLAISINNAPADNISNINNNVNINTATNNNNNNNNNSSSSNNNNNNNQNNIDSNKVLWIETYLHHVTFNATPIDISEEFKQHSRQIEAAWIFTSATLSVGTEFSHFCKPLGLLPDVTLQLDSPFNYPHISVLYLPKDLPEPSSPLFNEAMLQATLPVLEASGGRAFILFTSHQALNQSIEFYQEHVEYPLFIQGTLPKIALIDAFRESGNGVLLGTSSFWEGVDVKGEALSCVIIAKLPFASPGDPIEQAKIDALKRGGGNPFMDYQLPRAVIALKQGVGRLIRDPEDHGVLMIADPRLTQKHYGKLFLQSLPNMTKTQDINRVYKFFAYVNARKS